MGMLLRSVAVVLALSVVGTWRVGDASAGNYTLTMTARHDAVLTRQLAVVNAARQEAGQPPFADVRAMLNFYAEEWTGSWLLQQGRDDSVSACARYQRLTAAQKATITGLLDGKEPCP